MQYETCRNLEKRIHSYSNQHYDVKTKYSSGEVVYKELHLRLQKDFCNESKNSIKGRLHKAHKERREILFAIGDDSWINKINEIDTVYYIHTRSTLKSRCS